MIFYSIFVTIYRTFVLYTLIIVALSVLFDTILIRFIWFITIPDIYIYQLKFQLITSVQPLCFNYPNIFINLILSLINHTWCHSTYCANIWHKPLVFTVNLNVNLIVIITLLCDYIKHRNLPPLPLSYNLTLSFYRTDLNCVIQPKPTVWKWIQTITMNDCDYHNIRYSSCIFLSICLFQPIKFQI